jgi:hypothetical protein
MERLEPSQRESISKMSSDRLRMKLAKAEFDEQQVAAMSREQAARCMGSGGGGREGSAAALLQQRMRQLLGMTWSWKEGAWSSRFENSSRRQRPPG